MPASVQPTTIYFLPNPHDDGIALAVAATSTEESVSLATQPAQDSAPAAVTAPDAPAAEQERTDSNV